MISTQTILLSCFVAVVIKQCEIDQKFWQSRIMGATEPAIDGTPLLHANDVVRTTEDAPNWRDLAENRSFQPGLLFRSSMGFSSQDLDKYGIKTVVDLRRKEAGPVEGVDYDGVKRVHIPMVGSKAGIQLLRSLPRSVLLQLVLTCFRNVEEVLVKEIMSSPESLARFYVLILENAEEILPQIFAILANEGNYPIMFHCVAGKDRTGILTALIYGLMGVDENLIIQDYSVSEENLRSRIQELSKYDQKLLMEGALMSPNYCMEHILEVIRNQYGSIEVFLVQRIGVSLNDIQNLRAILRKSNV